MFKKSIIFVFAVLIFVCQIFGNDPVQAAVRGRYEADAVTYMKFSDMDQALPVSFVQKGQQLLTGDGEKNVDSILRETVLKNALPAEQLPGMEAGAVYGKGRQPDDPGMVITNGSWELFPDQAEYQAYSIWKQPAKYRWKKYFKKFLKKQSVDSPVVIKESYTFDWNGVKIELVTASNVLVAEDMDLKVSDGKKGQLPRNSHAAAYTVSALFRNGKAVLNIFSDVQPVSAGQKESAGGIAFSQPSKGTEYQDYIELVQFGDNKEWKKFGCMFDMNGESIMREYRYVHKYLLCDLDGDGQSELAAYHNGSGSLWQQMVVYRLINGVPERSFSVKP